MQEVFEKIIDQLKAESIIVDDEAGNRAVEIIEQAAAEYNNGWIPVEERLPGENGNYIVSVRNKENEQVLTMISGYSVNLMFFEIEDDYQEVIAWQPLSPAYQPKGE